MIKGTKRPKETHNTGSRL